VKLVNYGLLANLEVEVKGAYYIEGLAVGSMARGGGVLAVGEMGYFSTVFCLGRKYHPQCHTDP